MFKEIIDIIRYIYKTKEFIPLHAPVFLGNEKKYLAECIDTTYVSSVGKFVDSLEEKIKEITGAYYAVAAVNGTLALQVALEGVGTKPGEYVLTQSLTFVATANAISHLRAIPIFIDSHPETLSLNPDILKTFLKDNAYLDQEGLCRLASDNRIIRACVPMHTFGNPALITDIIEICNHYNIIVVEDAAESLGSKHNGIHTGLLGECGILSFNGNKIVTSGGGGAIITNNVKLGERLKHITTTAKIKHPWNFEHDYRGHNFRMPNLNAALACAQLEQIDNFLDIKRHIANSYKDFFSKQDGVRFFDGYKSAESNHWLNAIVFDDPSKQQEFLIYSNENNVMTRPIWKPMHLLDIYKECLATEMPYTEYFYNRVVNIPSGVPKC